jgi:hypothetical protein
MALLRTPRNGTVKIVEQGSGTPVVVPETGGANRRRLREPLHY